MNFLFTVCVWVTLRVSDCVRVTLRVSDSACEWLCVRETLRASDSACEWLCVRVTLRVSDSVCEWLCVRVTLRASDCVRVTLRVSDYACEWLCVLVLEWAHIREYMRTSVRAYKCAFVWGVCAWVRTMKRDCTNVFVFAYEYVNAGLCVSSCVCVHESIPACESFMCEHACLRGCARVSVGGWNDVRMCTCAYSCVRFVW